MGTPLGRMTSRTRRCSSFSFCCPPTTIGVSSSLTLIRRWSSLSSSSSPLSTSLFKTTASTLRRQGTTSFLSTAAAAAAPAVSVSNRLVEALEKSNYDLYVWGSVPNGRLFDPSKAAAAAESSTTANSKSDSAKSKLFTPTYVPWDSLVVAADEDDDDSDIGTLQQIVCGPTDTALLMSDGSCYVIGENKEGQLGVGLKGPLTGFHRLKLPYQLQQKVDGEQQQQQQSTFAPIQQISLGNRFSAMIDTDGDLYTVGSNQTADAVGLTSETGMLGRGPTTPVKKADDTSQWRPGLVESLVQDGCYARQVQVGELHMTVLTTEGEVLSCGAGTFGRLGNFVVSEDVYYLEPVEVLKPDDHVVQIAGGRSFTLALTQNGVVYGWGRNHKGQLGGIDYSGEVYAMQSIPEPVFSDELMRRKVIKIAAGHSHSACITASGEVFYWGMSTFMEPTLELGLVHTQIVDVACGHDYTLMLDRDGSLYSMGFGPHGGLGHGDKLTRLYNAKQIEELKGKKVVQISAGWKHAACLVEKE